MLFKFFGDGSKNFDICRISSYDKNDLFSFERNEIFGDRISMTDRTIVIFEWFDLEKDVLTRSRSTISGSGNEMP
jgi:hypothetical protein